jgi:putative CocE/NonD family hydrolase
MYQLLFVFLASMYLNAQDIQVIEHFYIPLSDGTKLATRMWLPKDSIHHPVPALLEYIPYRKRDGTRRRDEPIASWYAQHGYAVLRVDLRGSGESDGYLDDEYLEIEQSDGLKVIEWIAKQPWCTGSVGMIGKSWGGFNALQIAALRPEALKAIVTVCSTDDRYSDDIHYMGGCLLNDNLWWGAIMMTYQARPPDPDLRPDWREEWLNRIQNMPFLPAVWMRHQRRDEYWKQGSICENWKAIQCPVMAIGGWADAYTNSIPRMLENLTVPRIGIIGPWAHVYPHDGTPGPAIGFLQETLRWWNHWLKGENNSITQEPLLRAYVEEWSPPSGWRDPVPGRWIAENAWPSDNIHLDKWYFGNQSLCKEQQSNQSFSILSPQWTGFCVGEWMGCGVPGEMPLDQRFDDGCSLVFDSLPLTTPLTILGAPQINLNVSSDKPVALLCARLCDVSPDGSSRRISYQILNLTHRNSHEYPEPLVEGQNYEIQIKLNDCGYVVQAGHRLRIAISTCYWPLIWPSPSPATLCIQTEKSYLSLPKRNARLEDSFVHFENPECGIHAPITLLKAGEFNRTANFDLLKGTASYITDGKGGLFGEGVYRFDETGTSLSHNLKRDLFIQKDDPLSANYKLTQSYEMEKNDLKVRIESKFEMSATEDEFNIKGDMQIYENDDFVIERIFEDKIDRDYL